MLRYGRSSSDRPRSFRPDKNAPATGVIIDRHRECASESGSQPRITYRWPSLVRLFGSGHEAIAVENAALRLQLAAYQRMGARPKLTSLLVYAVQSLAWVENRSVRVVERRKPAFLYARSRVTAQSFTSDS